VVSRAAITTLFGGEAKSRVIRVGAMARAAALLALLCC